MKKKNEKSISSKSTWYVHSNDGGDGEDSIDDDDGDVDDMFNQPRHVPPSSRNEIIHNLGFPRNKVFQELFRGSL